MKLCTKARWRREVRFSTVPMRSMVRSSSLAASVRKRNIDQCPYFWITRAQPSTSSRPSLPSNSCRTGLKASRTIDAAVLFSNSAGTPNERLTAWGFAA